jgi:hypothetical protein
MPASRKQTGKNKGSPLDAENPPRLAGRDFQAAGTKIYSLLAVSKTSLYL